MLIILNTSLITTTTITAFKCFETIDCKTGKGIWTEKKQSPKSRFETTFAGFRSYSIKSFNKSTSKKAINWTPDGRGLMVAEQSTVSYFLLITQR